MFSHGITDNSRWMAVLAFGIGFILAASSAPPGEPGRPASRGLYLAPDQRPSRVAWSESSHVVSGRTVHRSLVREMLEGAIVEALETESVEAAWRTILAPDDVIGIKFDPVGARELGTAPIVGGVLIESLVRAGWLPRQIVVIDGPPELARQFGTLPSWQGYDAEPTDFGSGKDQLASVLRQVTALINVASLKTDNVTHVRCCLSNISLGLLKHPARFRIDGGSPYIADIAALKVVRSKLKLCLVDGLRVVYDAGPMAVEENTSDEGILLVSLDPVAADSVALGIVNQVRKKKDLPPIARSVADVPSIADANRKGIGIAISRGIDVVRRVW